MERLQQREHRARLPAVHQYRAVLVLVSLRVIFFLAAVTGWIRVVLPHVRVVVRRQAQAVRHRAAFDAVSMRAHACTAPGLFASRADARGPGPRPLVAQSTDVIAAAATIAPEAGAEPRADEAHVLVHAPRVRPERVRARRRSCLRRAGGYGRARCTAFPGVKGRRRYVRWTETRTSFTSLQVKRTVERQ